MKAESCREEEEGGRLWEELQEKLEGETGCNLRGRVGARDHERAARGVGEEHLSQSQIKKMKTTEFQDKCSCNVRALYIPPLFLNCGLAEIVREEMAADRHVGPKRKAIRKRFHETAGHAVENDGDNKFGGCRTGFGSESGRAG